MKKILSVLIAAIMLMSCCSVGFVSFAASVPTTAADASALIAKDTEYYTTTATGVAYPGMFNEYAFDLTTASYSFARTTTPSQTTSTTAQLPTDADELDTLKGVIAAKYKETGAYENYITFADDTHTIISDITTSNLIKIVNDRVGIADFAKSFDSLKVSKVVVNKSIDGANLLGADALTKIELDPADMLDYKTNGSFTMKEIILADDTDPSATLSTTESSSLATLVKTLIPSTTAADVKAELESREGVTAVKDYKFAITNIKVTPSYKTVTIDSKKDVVINGVPYAKSETRDMLASLKIEYTISISASVQSEDFGDIWFPYTAKSVVATTYGDFTLPTETDLTASKVLNAVNSETTALAGNAVGTLNAGYAFEKTVSNIGLLANTFGLAAAKTTVNAGSDAQAMLGGDALKATTVTADKASAFTGTALTSATSVSFADVDLAKEKASTSVVAQFASVVPDDAVATATAALSAIEGVTKVDNVKLAYTGIKLEPTFAKSGTETQLTKLVFSYTLSISADLTKEDGTTTAYSDKAILKNTYSSIARYVPGTIDVASIVDLINAETAFASTPSQGHHTSGYDINKTVESSTPITLAPADAATLKNIVLNNSNYSKKFANNITVNGDTTLVDFDGILKSILGLNSVTDSINKSVIGSEIIGKDALIATTLDAKDVTTFTGNKFTDANITLNFADVTIIPGDNVSETCPVGDTTANVISSNIAKDVSASVAANVKSTTVEDMKITYKNISLQPVFKQVTDAAGNISYQLTSLTLTYSVDFSANIYAVNAATPIPVATTLKVNVVYNNFNRFVEGTDIDAYEFVEKLNDATAYANMYKTGYDYQRNAKFTTDPECEVLAGSTAATITGALDGVLGKVTGGTPTASALSDGMKKILLGDMNVTDFNGTVPATKDAAEALGNEDYAIKSTTLAPNDVFNLQYNADRGIITFKLRDQVNPEAGDAAASLAKLTNDYVSTSELRQKLTISLNSGNGISLMGAEDPCNVAYTDINGYVSFNSGDASNVYGDGKLSKLGVNYDCTLDVTASGLQTKAAESVDTEANAFTYVDYAKGDVDMSGKVSIVDARMILKAVTGSIQLNSAEKFLADMDNNNKVAIVDARLILKMVTA